MLTRETEYNIPNDESENDRLDLQHNLCLLTLDNTLGLAPPNKPDSNVKRVLDVGTGSGIWAVEFGEEHPEAEVIGIDLSPSMPQFVPPNVRFEIDDLEEEWIWSQPFDYIHSRMMNSSVGDWKTYAKNAFDNLTPGGFFEINEIGLFPRSDDGTLPPDSSLSKCIDLMYEASIIFGRPYQEPTELVAILESVGFLDVQLSLFKWPSNTWPKNHKYKELGLWNNANLTSGFEALSMGPLTRAHGWTREEVQVLLVDVRKDLSNQNIHAYWPM
ncbi:hypothetical protein CPLU01_06021 [Colletotrichum plurivorum]|uniref:Methyltransferase domain-containing protein n=1 Tax=Colletotrichum plurivorum TaxID=2175906 RepID=A0A8H6NHD1_9PEZI|nr:hypothetical protein CPLU01_06021 [Colletotrichum plurivorum]